VSDDVIMAAVELAGTAELSPRMARVTLQGEALRGFSRSPTPAWAVKLFVPPPGQSELVLHASEAPGPLPAIPRSFTIRRVDTDAGELDIDVNLHADGVFMHWLRRARPGEPVGVAGPRHFPAPAAGADGYVLAADESGLPALATILEALPAGPRVHAFVEVHDGREEQAFGTRADVEVVWLHRHPAPAGTAGLLERAVRELDWPAGRVEVWMAGEGAEIRSLRAFVRDEGGAARSSLRAAGYWRRGRSESELDVAQLPKVMAAYDPGADPALVAALDEMHLDA
jgi:NADPH-dependent ferric siderophore reductase